MTSWIRADLVADPALGTGGPLSWAPPLPAAPSHVLRRWSVGVTVLQRGLFGRLSAKVSVGYAERTLVTRQVQVHGPRGELKLGQLDHFHACLREHLATLAISHEQGGLPPGDHHPRDASRHDQFGASSGS